MRGISIESFSLWSNLPPLRLMPLSGARPASAACRITSLLLWVESIWLQFNVNRAGLGLAIG